MSPEFESVMATQLRAGDRIEVAGTMVEVESVSIAVGKVRPVRVSHGGLDRRRTLIGSTEITIEYRSGAVSGALHVSEDFQPLREVSTSPTPAGEESEVFTDEYAEDVCVGDWVCLEGYELRKVVRTWKVDHEAAEAPAASRAHDPVSIILSAEQRSVHGGHPVGDLDQGQSLLTLPTGELALIAAAGSVVTLLDDATERSPECEAGDE